MDEIFRTKVRRIGTSFGILIPKKTLKANKIRLGEEVELALLKRRRLETIEKLMGIAKGSAQFKRSEPDRV